MDRQTFSFFQEDELTAIAIEINANPIATADLVGRDQVRQRLYQ
jgi:hypothetical protein